MTLFPNGIQYAELRRQRQTQKVLPKLIPAKTHLKPIPIVKNSPKRLEINLSGSKLSFDRFKSPNQLKNRESDKISTLKSKQNDMTVQANHNVSDFIM